MKPWKTLLKSYHWLIRFMRNKGEAKLGFEKKHFGFNLYLWRFYVQYDDRKANQ